MSTIKLQIPSRVLNLLLALFDVQDVVKKGKTTTIITADPQPIMKFLGNLQ